LGEKYIKILSKRYPDFSTRMARLIGASLSGRR